MSTVAEIEKAIEKLSEPELRAFREWFQEFEADAWDKQFEQDVRAGKLDHLAKQVMAEHRAGQSTPFPANGK